MKNTSWVSQLGLLFFGRRRLGLFGQKFTSVDVIVSAIGTLIEHTAGNPGEVGLAPLVSRPS